MTVKDQFEILKKLWLNTTKYSSAPTYNNTYYLEIINLGIKVVPFLIEDLNKNRSDWFHALDILTKQSPIKKEHAGIVKLMIEDWDMWWANNKQNFK